jgi:hypothetical protein
LRRPVEGVDAFTTSDEVCASTVYRSADENKETKR